MIEYRMYKKSIFEEKAVDPFRLKYRQQIKELMQETIQNCLDAGGSNWYAQVWTDTHIDQPDRARFMEIIQEEMLNLYFGNIARFGISIVDFERWQKKFYSISQLKN